MQKSVIARLKLENPLLIQSLTGFFITIEQLSNDDKATFQSSIIRIESSRMIEVLTEFDTNTLEDMSYKNNKIN